MSAPNQVQQNAQPGAYYLDQYEEKTIALAAAAGVGAIGMKTRIHKEGNLVMITVDWNNVANPGIETINYSSVAGAIPAKYISATNAPYGGIVKIDTGASVKGLAILSISSVGQIVIYPSGAYAGTTAGSLPAQMFVTQCTFSYFI